MQTHMAITSSKFASKTHGHIWNMTPRAPNISRTPVNITTSRFMAPSHYLNQWWFIISWTPSMTCLCATSITNYSLHWRHNDHDGVSNHQPHGCLLNRLFGGRSEKTSKLRVTGLCVGNSPGTGEFPAQRASYAENVSIWWRHHVLQVSPITDVVLLEQGAESTVH